MKTIEIKTRAREEIVDITAEVGRLAAASGVAEGSCIVFVPHTTAAVTINENADPDVKADILMALRKAVPDSSPTSMPKATPPPTPRPAWSVRRSR
jgi:secondary thiamine-phosphate synthase enzyme